MERLRNFLATAGICHEWNCLLKKHATFRIGGPCTLACFPTDRKQTVGLLQTLARCEIPYLVIGNGSNVLFSDAGFDGVVVFTGQWKELTAKEHRIVAGAGASLLALSTLAHDLSLSGMEFSYGIPATVGGAVLMNAGAFGGCMADVCVRSEYFDAQTGELGYFNGAEQAFGNRTSIYEKQSRYTVLGAELCLMPDDKDVIRARMEDFLARRKQTQPLEFPSAGSVFKRPTGHFAGKLIEDCGLKGRRVGGAEVSTKHAGFIINLGDATAEDVRTLVAEIQEIVLRETGVLLEPEIRFL